MPSLMHVFIYIILPWCTKGLGGQEYRESNWDQEVEKGEGCKLLHQRAQADDKTGEGWDLLRPRPPEGVAAREQVRVTGRGFSKDGRNAGGLTYTYQKLGSLDTSCLYL